MAINLSQIESAEQQSITGEPTPKQPKGKITMAQIEAAHRASLGESPAEVSRLGAGITGYDQRPDKFDFQMRTYGNNAELRANRFGALKSFGAGTGKLLSNTLTGLGTGLSDVFIGIPTAIATGDANQIFDNAISQSLTDAESYMNEEIFPIYNSVKDQNKNILHRALTDAEFWSDDILGEGIPFLASAWLTGYGAMKLLRPLTKAKYLSAIEAATGRGIEETAALAKNLSRAEQLTASFAARTVEGLVEAKDTRDQVYNKLTARGMSPNEAAEEAGKAAMATFGLNYALLPIEYIQAGSWFKTFAKSRDEILQMTKKGLEVPKRYALNKAASEAGINMITEGPVEENFQKAVQDYVYNRFTGNDADEVLPWQTEFKNGLDGLFTRMGENFTTKEGWDAIGTGSILGGLFGGASAFMSANSKAEKQRLNELKQNLDIFSQDKEKVNDRITNLINNIKGYDKLDKLSKTQALKGKEQFWNVFETLKFGEYAFENFEAGLGGRLMDQIDEMSSLSESEFMSGYKNQTKVDELKNKATQYEGFYNTIVDRFQIPDTKEGRNIRQSLFREAIIQDQLNSEISKLQPQIEQLREQIRPSNDYRRFLADRNHLVKINKDLKKTVDEIRNSPDEQWKKTFGTKLAKRIEKDIKRNSKEVARLDKLKSVIQKDFPGIQKRNKMLEDQLNVTERNLVELENALTTSLHRYDLLANPETQRSVSGLMVEAEKKNNEAANVLNNALNQQEVQAAAESVAAQVGKPVEKILSNQPQPGDTVVGTVMDDTGKRQVQGTVNPDGTVTSEGKIQPISNPVVVQKKAEQDQVEDLVPDMDASYWEQFGSMFADMGSSTPTPKVDSPIVTPQDSAPLDSPVQNPDDELTHEEYLFEDRKMKTDEFSLGGKDIQYVKNGDVYLDEYDANGTLIRGNQTDFYNYVNDPATQLRGVVGKLKLIDKGKTPDDAHIRITLPNGLDTSIHTTEFIKNNIAKMTPERIKEFSKWRAQVVDLLLKGQEVNLTLTGKGPGILLRNQKVGTKRARRKINQIVSDLNTLPVGITIKSKQGEEHLLSMYDWKGAPTPAVSEIYGFGVNGRVYVGLPAANGITTPVPVWSRNINESEAKIVINAIRKRFEGRSNELIPGSTWTYNDIIRFYIYPSSTIKAYDVFISDNEKMIRIGQSRYGQGDIATSYPQDLVAALMGKTHQVQNKRLSINEEVPLFNLVNDQLVVDSFTRYRNYLLTNVLETDIQPLVVNGKNLYFGQPTITYDSNSAFSKVPVIKTEPKPESKSDQDLLNDFLSELSPDDDIFNLPAPKIYVDTPSSNEVITEKEIEWFKKNMPDIPINIVPDLIRVESLGGMYAVGTFEKGLINLYENAPEGTLYHEAFHAVFRMMLTDSEKEQLLKEQGFKLQTEPEEPKFTPNLELLKNALSEDYTQFLNSKEREIKGVEKLIPTRAIFLTSTAPKVNRDGFNGSQTEIVDITDIVPSKPFVSKEYVSTSTAPITVQYANGKYLLLDGHERVARMALSGARKFKVKVLYSSKKDYAKRPVYKNYTAKQEFQLEEELANKFEQFMLSDGKMDLKPKTRNFFQRIWDMIKKFILGKKDIRTVFQRIRDGYYKFNPLDPSKAKGIAPKAYNLTSKEEVGLMNFMSRRFFGDVFKLESFDLNDITSLDVTNEDVVKIYEGIRTNLKTASNKLPQSDLKSKYDHILANFDEVIKSHQVWMTKYKLQLPDIDFNPEEENLKLRDSFNAREATDVSAKDNANFIVKLFISALPKMTKEGDTVRNVVNELGLPEVVDYNETWNFLLDKLSGSTTIPEVISKLQPYTDVKPEVNIILNLISKPGTFTQELFKTQLLQSFSKFNTNPVTTLFTWGSDERLNVITVGADIQDSPRAIVKMGWSANFFDSDMVEIDPLSRTDDYITKNPIIEQRAAQALKGAIDVPSTKDGLAKFGITFTKNAVESWIKQNEPNKFISAGRYILSRLANADFKDKQRIFTSFEENTNINLLADIESQFNPSMTEAVHLNPENKPTYHHVQHNFLSRVVSDIQNGDKSYVTKILNTYYGANSQWASAIKSGLQPQLKLLEGARLEDARGKITTKLTPGMWIATRINAILQEKPIFPVLRPAEKKSEYGIQGFELVKSGVTRTGITATGINNQALVDQFYGYFEDEYKRAIYAYLKERKKTNGDIPQSLLQYLGLPSENDIDTNSLEPFDTRGKSLTFFEPIISKYNIPLINELKNFHRPTVEEIQEIKIAIKKYLADEINNTFDYLVDKSVVRVVDSEGYKTSRVPGYTNLKLNGTVANIENVAIGKTQLDRYAGDSFAAIADFAVNEMVATFEYIKLTMGDVAFYKDFFKRTPLVTGTGKIARIDVDIAKDIQPEYSKLRAEYPLTKSKDQINNGDLMLAVVKSPKKQSSQLEEMRESLKSLKLSDKEIDDILEGYKGYDEADAFSWITPQAAREFLMRIGDWNANLESVYQNIINNKPVKYKQLKGFMTAIKLMGAGPMDINDPHILPIAYLKTATMPLIPSAIKGRELENLLKRMYESGTDMVIVDSGSKAVSYNMQNFYDSTGRIDTTQLSNAKFNFKYVKLQLDVQQQSKNKVVFGTQLRKLIFSNLFEWKDDKLQDKDIKVAGKQTKLSNVWSEFNQLYDKLTTQYRDQMLKDIGILYNFEDDTYKVVDYNIVVNKLRSEAQGRFYPKSVIEAIKLNAEGNGLDIPGDAMINRKSIENLLNAIVFNSVISQKMSGTSSVQIPVTGFEPSGKIKSVVDSTGELKFIGYKDGQITEAEVYLPHNFRAKFGYLNDLDISQVDDDVLKFIGFRIPTEGLRSIIKIKVKGFLPREMGDVVVVPSELVAQAGSDFDIDKLNIMQPHYYYDAESKRVKRVSSSDESVQGIENRILEITEGLISHKDAFVPSLKTTGQTVDYLKSVAADIRRLKEEPVSRETNPLSIIEFGKKMETAYKFIAGKDGVGVAALHNTHHVLTQAGNIKLTPEATEILGFKYNQSGGLASLAGRIDSEGRHEILDITAAALNGFVDIVKDPFIVDLFTDLNTASTAMTLIRLGAPVEWVAKFINQPLIQRYVKNLEFAKSELGRMTKTGDPLSKLRLQYYNSLDERGKTLVDTNTWTLTTPMYKNLTTTQLDNYIDVGYTDGLVADRLEDISNNNKNITPNEYYLSQLSLLSDFLNYEQLALKLRVLMANSASDTHYAKSFNDVDRFVRRKEQYSIDTAREDLGNTFSNYQNLFDNTFIQSFYNNGMKVAHRAFKELFPIRQSESVQNAVRRVEALVGKTNRLRDYEIEKISDSLMGYIMYQSLSKQEMKDFLLDEYNHPEERLLVSNTMKNNLIKRRTDSFFKTKNVYKKGQKLNLNDMYSVEITGAKKVKAMEMMKSEPEKSRIMGIAFLKPNTEVFVYSTRIVANSIKKKSGIRKIHELQKSDHPINNNLMFKNLKVQFSRKANGVNVIRFKVRPTDNIVHEDLVEHWRRLFNDGDPEVRKVAHDLMKYSIYQSGMKQSNISFFKYIPAEEFSRLINSSIESFDQNLDDPSILNMLFRNFWKDNAFVPKISFFSQVGPIRSEKGELIGYTLKASSPLNKEWVGTPPPFLKINNQAGGFNLLELVGFTGEKQSGEPVYVITSKLGDGTILTEYHNGPSIYDDNNNYVEGSDEIYKYVSSSSLYWTANIVKAPVIEESIAHKSDTYTDVEAESDEHFNVDLDDDFGDAQALGDMFADMLQLSTGDSRKPDNRLNDLLRAKLAEIGVSVEYIDNIITKSGSAIAAANMLNKTVQIAKGKESITTLPEEAAHMFVAMMDGPLMDKMLRDISNYNVYNETVKEYSEVYNGDDRKIRQEAVGKLISQIIVNEFSNETSSNIEKAKNWWNRVWEIVKKILSRLNLIGIDEYTSSSPSIYKNFAMDILNKKSSKDLSEIITDNNFDSIILQLTEKDILNKICK